MKRSYLKPKADLTVFRSVEGLANSELDFNKLISIKDTGTGGGAGAAADTSATDIKIKI